MTDPDLAPLEAPSAPAVTAPGWRRWLPWVRKWGVSIASFIGGLLTLFVFRREVTHARWIIGNLLLIWLLFAVLTQMRQTLEAKGHRFVITAVDYLIQTLYHGVLLFLLPVYWASTTLTSPNVGFLLLLMALALLATFDPWYHALIHPLPWLGYVFFLASIFGALNLAFPLIGLAPNLALLVSAWLSVVALTPTVCRAWGWRWSLGLWAMMVAGVLVAGLAYWGRAWIPPVPLSLSNKTVAWDTASVESLEPVAGAIPAAELRQRGLIAYTAIYAPAGLRQAVQHVWRRDQEIVDVVSLSPVHGGRREGFRTYSRKTAFPEHAAGHWSVDVVTSSGQLIGRLQFRVTP